MFYSAIRPLLDPVVKSKILFNIPLTDIVPPEQLDAEWAGGQYHFHFDPDVYWHELTDFCGIRHDGVRTHPSFAQQQQPPQPPPQQQQQPPLPPPSPPEASSHADDQALTTPPKAEV